jgi:hypothetical protein
MDYSKLWLLDAGFQLLDIPIISFLKVTNCNLKLLNSSITFHSVLRGCGIKHKSPSSRKSDKRGFVGFHYHGSDSRFLALSGGCYVWRINYLTLNEKIEKINGELCHENCLDELRTKK